MSNFQIHELNSVAVNRNSNIIHDTEVSTDEWDTGKDIAGAVADLASANVAAPYDETVTYAIGQYCLREGNIYRCIAPTTGAFDSTKWTQIVVTGEFRRVVELTSAQYTALSSAEKNNGTLYIITDEETTAADIPYSAGVSVADMLTPEAVTTVALGSAVDNTQGSYILSCYQVGKIVQVYLVGAANSTWVQFTSEIIKGLPKPKDANIRYPVVKLSAGTPYGYGTTYQTIINSNGTLTPSYIPNGAIANGDSWLFSFSYIAE